MSEESKIDTENVQDLLGVDLDLGITSSLDLSALNGQNFVIATGATNPIYTYHTNSGMKLDTNGQAIQLNNTDLGLVLNQILDRLKILVPDPELLEKHEALAQAYEHYKTLEALCAKSHDKND